MKTGLNPSVIKKTKTYPFIATLLLTINQIIIYQSNQYNVFFFLLIIRLTSLKYFNASP